MVRYLARYTYRTALSNRRLLKLRGDRVLFTWKDRKAKRWRRKWLTNRELVQRFSQHILPKRFKRVRFYGLLAATKRGSLLGEAQWRSEMLAQLDGFSHAVRCSFSAEELPQARCRSCGHVGLRKVALHQPWGLIHLDPGLAPIPPPRSMRPTPQEA